MCGINICLAERISYKMRYDSLSWIFTILQQFYDTAVYARYTVFSNREYVPLHPMLNCEITIRYYFSHNFYIFWGTMGTFSQLFTPKMFYTNVNFLVIWMKTVDFNKDLEWGMFFWTRGIISTIYVICWPPSNDIITSSSESGSLGAICQSNIEVKGHTRIRGLSAQQGVSCTIDKSQTHMYFSRGWCIRTYRHTIACMYLLFTLWRGAV